jgi:hypothetical protein
MTREDITRIAVFVTALAVGVFESVFWLRRRPFNYWMVTIVSAVGSTLIIIFAMVGQETPLTPGNLGFAVLFWLAMVGSTYFIMRTLARRRQAAQE